jgi:hypothetical protein
MVIVSGSPELGETTLRSARECGSCQNCDHEVPPPHPVIHIDTPAKMMSDQSPVISLWKFALCVVLVRWFLYEWRPWHELNLLREIAVWLCCLLVYRSLQRRTTARPLLNYGRWALVEDGYQHLFGPSLQSRGLQVAVLSNNSTVSWKQSTAPLSNWLGTQHWNGGVGVYVTSSEVNMDYIIQHMAFRSSGAILVLGGSRLEKHSSRTITLLEIPPYLQTSPSLAEASLKALGYSRRLRLHHVLLQQVKDIAVVWRGGLLRRQ